MCLLETKRRRIWEIDRKGILGSIFSLAKGFEKSGFLTLRLFSIKLFDFFSCIVVLFSIMCGCDGGSFIGWFDALYSVHHSTHLIAIVGFMDIVHNRCNSCCKIGGKFPTGPMSQWWWCYNLFYWAIEFEFCDVNSWTCCWWSEGFGADSSGLLSEFDSVFAAEDASIRPRFTFHWRFKCQLYLDTQNPFNASLRPLKVIFKFATSPLPHSQQQSTVFNGKRPC